MMIRRLYCAVLVLAAFLSLPLPASAAGLREDQRATVVTATMKLPKIRVTVPSMRRVYLNPLEIPVKIGDVDDDEQILSAPATLANQSDAALRVDVSVTGKIRDGSTMSLSSTSTKGSASTAKTAFIYFELKPSNSDDPDDVRWDKVYDSEKHILVTEGTRTKENIITLSAMTLDGEVARGGYCAFRLTGDAVAEPEIAWNSRDGVNVEVAFTFTPLPYDEWPQ